MAGEQKRKRRSVLVTKALLLGYNIKREGGMFCNLQLPSGGWLLEDGLPRAFAAQWLAAEYALKLSGVIDAKVPQKDKRAGGCSLPRLR
jgi:hypothetical protein